MFNVKYLQKLYALLPFLSFLADSPEPSLEIERSTNWTNETPLDWAVLYPHCNGSKQSPIDIGLSFTYTVPLSRNEFSYYDIPLSGNVTILNNGHAVEFDIPVTTNGSRPLFTGGMQRNTFEAIKVHFHWGTEGQHGSEHTIRKKRFDVEMHIVHKNVIYNTTEEAYQNEDGLAVLAVFFNIAKKPVKSYPGLDKIFDKLPEITEYSSSAVIDGPLTLGQLLGDINTKKFYTYSGSLTTPPCSESVSWIIYPEPLLIAHESIERFWALSDHNGSPLINNFRPLQSRNARPAYYRLSVF